MRFLILGGNGYLGSKITKVLLEKGHSIVCTKRQKSDFSRLAGYMDYITMIPATTDKLKEAFTCGSFDWVLNMVCSYEQGKFFYDNVIESNIVFPLSALNLAVEHGIENYLTIGTALPNELNMYSFTKSQFSGFGEFYAKKHGINFIDVKLEMFYGSDEPKGRFISNCIIKMLQNQDMDLTIGTQKRDIVSIHDVVSAMLCIIRAEIEGYCEIPVGTGEAPTIRDITTYIKRECGSRSNLNFGIFPMRKGEPDCIADIAKLTDIGYRCKYSWKQGIREMIKEIRENQFDGREMFLDV